MYFIKTPKIAKLFYRDMIWEIPTKENTICLTFDDGPEESSTPKILQILKKYNVKATFFCTGIKAKNNPELVEKIIGEGHAVGNHSFRHHKGNIKNTKGYINDIKKCNDIIDSEFFRPPYGKISRRQINALKKDYKIIMWTVMPGDFDSSVSKELLLKRSIRYTKSGTIIVFHDNSKTINKVEYALPHFLEHFINKGFTIKPISQFIFP